MSGIIMTIHTFNHSYAGFSASEIHRSCCGLCFLPARLPRRLFIDDAGSQHLRVGDQKRCGEMWRDSTEICGGEEPLVVDLRSHSSTRMFDRKREHPNLNFNEVSL